MSSFNGGDWWQGMQGLFNSPQGNQPWMAGQQQAHPVPPGGYVGTTGWWTGTGVPAHTPAIAKPGDLGERVVMGEGSGPNAPFTYGQAMAGAAMQDYRNAEAARQKDLAMYQGLFGNVMGSMQGAGQMVGDARNAANQNMAGFQTQADALRRASGEGQRFYDEATRQMQGSLAQAQRGFQQGVDTLKASRANYDSTFRGDTAADVMGIQQQYKNQQNAIANRSDLTDEQKGMMQDELKQNMHQQSSALASQASARARDALAAMDQNIGNLQASGGLQLGQMGIGVGQAMGQLGMQSAAMKQQAEEQIASLWNNMSQFNSSLVQSAQANALQYSLNGNQFAAQLIAQMPFGPKSIFESLATAVDALGVKRDQNVSPEMARLFGGMR